MKKKRLVIAVVILILVIALVYFIFFYRQNCKDEGCFGSAMAVCKKVNFINDGDEASWGYIIKGKSGDDCIINVELLQAKQGSVELGKIQGLSMDCNLPFGFVGAPQADLTRCHGLLKEELQELMIQKMHAYILSNLGKIDEALKSAL